MNEEWRPVVGWPAYEVSDQGRVRRGAPGRGRRAGMMLRAGRRSGYPSYNLSHGTIRRHFRIHELVAAAFLPPPPGLRGLRAGQYQINHVDGDKLNNRPENLEWVTPGGNLEHAYRIGLQALGIARWNAKLSDDQVREIRRRYAAGEQTLSIALAFGVSVVYVREIARGQRRVRCGGPITRRHHLTVDDVRAIRARLAEVGNQTHVATEFGVSASTVGLIARGRSWRTA